MGYLVLGTTNIQVVFKQLFKSIHLNKVSMNSDEPAMLVYISANKHASYNDTASILAMIAHEQATLQVPVIINTVFVTNGMT